jgi:hypothetical protein
VSPVKRPIVACACFCARPDPARLIESSFDGGSYGRSGRMTCLQCNGIGKFEQRVNQTATSIMAAFMMGAYLLSDGIKRPTEIVTYPCCGGEGEIVDCLPLSEQEGACRHDGHISAQSEDEVTLRCRYCGKHETA